MISRPTVSSVMAAALVVLATAPALAQLAPQQAEDARLRDAAAQRASDPLWAALTKDGFGQSAWDALASPAQAARLAVDPNYNRYGPNELAKAASTKAAPSVASLLKALIPATGSGSGALASTSEARSVAGEAVTMTARDLGNGISENRYYITMMTQTFDGVFDRAFSQKAGFARVRNANESWVRIDYGDGALVIREPERPGSPATAHAGRFVNTTPTEVAMAYDYRTNRLTGNPLTAAYHNTYIRPLMSGAPALGSNVTWSVALSAEKLGVAKARSGDFRMEVKRTYFSRAGTPYVILEYTVPDFSYGNAFGDKVTHRARGVALADPQMGQIFWNASLQTATASEKGGKQRPYRYARTGFAMDASGKPLLDLNQIPEMKKFVEEFYGAAASAPLPFAWTSVPDQTPLEMAAKIDMAGFTFGENSANQLLETIGSTTFGENGNGQAAGASVDGLIASYTFNISDKLNTFLHGMHDAYDFNQVFGQRLQNATDFYDITGVKPAELRSLQNTISDFTENSAALRKQAETLQRELSAVQQRITLETRSLAKLESGLNSTEDFFHVYDQGLMRNLADNEARAKNMLKELGRLNTAISDNALAARALNELVKPLQVIKEGLEARGIVQVVGQFNNLLKTTKIALGMSVLSNLSNAATIYGTREALANFDPGAAGDLTLQGKYNSTGELVGDLTLNMMSIIGNAASGNVKSLISDVSAFTVGRFGDLYMAVEAAHAAQGQAQVAFMEQVLTARRYHSSFTPKIEAMLVQVHNLGSRIQQLDQEVNSRPTVRAQTDDWTDPRFEADGRPIPSYWAWLKANSPDTLRRMGIDPDAPVGGWPNGVRPRNLPAPTAQQPRQPGGPDYPTRDPSTVRRNNPEPVPATGPLDNNPGAVMDEMAAATTGRRTNNYVPPPRRPARDDHIGTDEQPNPLRFSGVEWDPVTFEPVNFEPVTWNPPTWEPPTWEPPTWDPPTWTPPHFDAPSASEIDFTDLGVGTRWPHTDNMAYNRCYGSFSLGRVAEDAECRLSGAAGEDGGLSQSRFGIDRLGKPHPQGQ